MKDIITASLAQSFTYIDFKLLVSKLIKEGKSTGEDQSEALLNYSVLSERRMKRLDKTLKITDKNSATILNTKKDLLFLVLMESWCGDGAQTLPVINKITEQSPKIDFKVVLRDQNEVLMNRFLTNGGKSIPKLLILDKNTLEVLETWGPRPSVATKMVTDYKVQNGSLDAVFKKDLQLWYNKDKGLSAQTDIVNILEKL